MKKHLFTPQKMAQVALNIEGPLKSIIALLPTSLGRKFGHQTIYKEVCIILMRLVSFSFWEARQEDEEISLSNERLFEISRLPLWDNTQLPILSSLIEMSELEVVYGEFIRDLEIKVSDMPLDQLGAFYEHLLQYTIGLKDNEWFLLSTTTRKKTGTHYTPPELCQFLVEQSLTQLTNELDIDELRTCDPAMGSGAFLLEMTRQLIRLTDAEPEQIVSKCIYGVDINPIAVWVSQFSLWLLGGENHPNEALLRNLCVGNSLFNISRGQSQRISFDVQSPIVVIDDNLEQVRDEMLNHFQLKVGLGWSARVALRHWSSIGVENINDPIKWSETPTHWDTLFEEVMLDGGFHIIIGNPPFVNAIRGGVSELMKAFLPKRYSLVCGAADLSYYFLALGVELLRSNGVLAYILPRVMLGANALKPFRTSIDRPKPMVLYSPDHTDYFANAQIRIVAAVFGSGSRLLVSRSESVDTAEWTALSNVDSSWWESYRGNWWTLFEMGTNKLSFPSLKNHISLLDSGFEVRGGLVTSEFYLVDVVEQVSGNELKLLTSGGIDPEAHFWGAANRRQRFRKVRYSHPRVLNSEEYPLALQKKLKQSRRPKIILANQTSVVEGFFDQHGEFQASTATMEIYHKQDSIEELQDLLIWLHGDIVHRLFHLCLGFNALGPGISLSKPFLQQLPVPKR